MFGLQPSVLPFARVLITAVLLKVCRCSLGERELSRHLMKGYNAKARPVSNDSDMVNISFSIALHHIMAVNEKSEVLTTNIWVHQYWTDPRLAWNKTRYKGIERIVLEPDKLWLPDISILNSATADMGVNGAEARVAIKHTGEISWFNPATLETSCGIDITYFPFDDQLCQLRFGSWSFSLPFMDIVEDGAKVDLSNFVENGEWKLLDAKAHREVKEYECCEGWYPEVTYEIHLRRRALYYIMNFIVPPILIAVLTLLVFLLPPESGERMSFGVTVLLSFTILILMLMAKLPATSRAIPLIGVYYACTIIEVSLAMFAACLTMRLYYPENQSAVLPGWAKVCVLNYCAKLVGLGKAADRVKQALIIQRLRQAKLRDHREQTSSSKLNVLTDNILAKEDADGIREVWRLSSIILNRLFALIYLVTIIVTLLVVMLQAPRIKSGNL